MLSVNGLLMDIRQAPLGAQVEAFRRGLIPYIPGHKEDSEAIAQQMQEGLAQDNSTSRKTTKTKPAKNGVDSTNQPTASAALQALYDFARWPRDG
jgi:ABC-type Zn uptake system ZnuABC Zn-binding protein ZnuA